MFTVHSKHSHLDAARIHMHCSPQGDYRSSCDRAWLCQQQHPVAGTCFAAQGQGQQQLLLAELKRVGTQQEQLNKAVSEAAAEAASRGETLEVLPLKSFKMSESELAHLKNTQLKNQLRTQAEAAAAVQAPAEGASPDASHAEDKTTLAVLPEAPAPASVGKAPTQRCAAQSPWLSLPRLQVSQRCAASLAASLARWIYYLLQPNNCHLPKNARELPFSAIFC